MIMDNNLIDYGGIFVSYIHKEDDECTFRAAEHVLLYVHTGRCDVISPNGTTSVNTGECVFIRKDHRLKLHKQCLADGTPFQGIALVFERKMLLDYYRRLDNVSLPDGVQRSRESIIKISRRPDIDSLFQSLTPFFNSDIEPDSQWIKMKLEEGLQCVLRTDKSVYASLFDFAEPWKIDILDFMNKNYMYDFTMDELANYTGRSLSTFKRDFKKATGTTPQKWLITKRLDAANNILLQNGGHKIQDVMADVGFTNLSFFSRSYKERFGYSPTETRNSK